jgi:hypothetical protein
MDELPQPPGSILRLVRRFEETARQVASAVEDGLVSSDEFTQER